MGAIAGDQFKGNPGFRSLIDAQLNGTWQPKGRSKAIVEDNSPAYHFPIAGYCGHHPQWREREITLRRVRPPTAQAQEEPIAIPSLPGSSKGSSAVSRCSSKVIKSEIAKSTSAPSLAQLD